MSEQVQHKFDVLYCWQQWNPQHPNMFLYLQWTPKLCRATHESPALSCYCESANNSLYISGSWTVPFTSPRVEGACIWLYGCFVVPNWQCVSTNSPSRLVSLELLQFVNNSLGSTIPTCYAFWCWLTAQVWLGQAHGINTVLSHQQKGNLIVYCPACCELGFNMEPQ